MSVPCFLAHSPLMKSSHTEFFRRSGKQNIVDAISWDGKLNGVDRFHSKQSGMEHSPGGNTGNLSTKTTDLDLS